MLALEFISYRQLCLIIPDNAMTFQEMQNTIHALLNTY